MIPKTQHLDLSLPQASPQAPAVRALRASVFRMAWLRGTVRGAGVYVLGWGVATLALRAWTDTPDDGTPGTWIWGSLGLLGVVILAGWRARRHMPDVAAAAAMLDQQHALGGLMMSAPAEGFAAWSGNVAAVQPLAVKWRGGPALLALLGAMGFLAGAVLAPMPAPAPHAASLHVKRQLETLREQVAVLEEEEVIDANKADDLRDTAQRVADDAKADDPVRAWEALDHLARQLEDEGAQAQEAAQQQSIEAAAAATLAQALAASLNDPASELSEAQLEAAVDALAQLSAAAMNGELPAMLDAATAEALAAGLDANALAALQDMMQGREAELADLMANLEAAGLNAGQAQGQVGAGEDIALDPDALKTFLEGQSDSECDGATLAAACKAGDQAGRGGINRGPGHMEMTWKDPASQEGASFDPLVLPPSALRDPAQSHRLGVSQTAPQVEHDNTASAGGGLNGVESAGGSAATTTVLPRHRGAVQRYFERRNSSDNVSGDATQAP
ncbi:MAG: hypothetical protein V3V20_08165 [Algisphaera sp.]